MEEIINSVMQSPENTNPNVLRSQLQKMGTGGSIDSIFFPVNVGFHMPFNLSEVPIQCEVDRTPNEVYEARTAGKIIVIRAYNIGSSGATYTNPTLNAYITNIQKNASSGYFVTWGSNFIIRDTFSFTSSGFTVNKSEKLYFVPDTSEATNGQVVTNDNGSPKWIDS